MKTRACLCGNLANGEGQTVLSDNLDYYVAIRLFTESWLPVLYWCHAPC